MDFIEKYDNSLSKDDCNRIINHFESLSHLHYQGTAGRKVNHKLKKSKSLDFSLDHTRWQPKDTYVANIIIPPLFRAIEKYKKKYRHLDDLAPWGINVDYHMQRFDKNDGYFAIHCEQEGPTSKRLIAWMYYLNNAKCGTKFYYQNKTFRARQGRLLIWPAGWTHMHSGVTPNLDTKYIITGWHSFYDEREWR